MRMRRRQVIRRPIFVGCEGDGERSYIRLVQRIVDDLHHKVHLDPHPLQPGGGDPLALVLRAEQMITKLERTRVRYHEKYLLIDRDTLGNSPERDQQSRRYSTASVRGSFGRTLPGKRSSCGTCRVARRVGRRALRSRCSSCGSNGPNT
jgi:hypothetical protein